ncbi:MAG: NAD(P)H-hydrate dehydratase [Fusobacteriaceae bacterium]
MKEKILEEKEIVSILKPRGKEGYKGDFGHTFIVAGSFNYVGAPYFAAEAAVRSGSGLVTLFTRKEILEIMKIKLDEAMVRDIQELKKHLQKGSALVFGSGMEESEEIYGALQDLKDAKSPLVIDADGLNVLKTQERMEFFREREGATIITPHLGEFSRLTGKKIEDIKKNRVKLAFDFAKKYGITLILKDSETIITDGREIYINRTGNASMSNGGMGDILAGLAGSFLAQGYTPLEAGKLACYFLGKCGEMSSVENYITNPRDVLQVLPKVMKKTVQKKCFVCYNIE